MALLAAWMLPALHALIHDAAHGALGGVAAAHDHARHCCGHDHPNSCPALHGAVAASDVQPRDPEPPRHDHESCDLCKLIAMGLNRLAPADAASTEVTFTPWCEPAEQASITTPAARVLVIAHARDPPTA